VTTWPSGGTPPIEKAGIHAHEVRVGTIDLLAQDRADLLFVDAIRSRRDHQHRPAAARAENQRLRDLPHAGADRHGGFRRGRGACIELEDLVARPEQLLHA
jgi:hypothetical protein